jgi:hypothetical protein
MDEILREQIANLAEIISKYHIGCNLPIECYAKCDECCARAILKAGYITVEQDIPIGATCHNYRDKDGQWWIVWGADFPQDKPGRKPHPNSIWLEDAYQQGIREANND